MKKTEQINQVKTILEVLSKTLLNRELYYYILENVLEITSKKIEIKENGISIKSSNKNMFVLTFEPSMENIQKIKTYEEKFNGKSIIYKEIEFEADDIINVIEKQCDVVKNEKNEIVSTEKNYSKRRYDNYSMIFNESCEMFLENSLLENNSYMKTTKIYVLEDNNAFIRTIFSNESEDTVIQNSLVDYSSTENYNVPNFNTRVNDEYVYMFGTHVSNEEEFLMAENEYMNKYFRKKDTKRLIRKI